MDVQKMKALFVAVELGSLNKAAESLQYTQAGLTRMMNSLENEIGIRLLERNHNGVELTDEAKSLAPAIKRLIYDYDELNEEIARLKKSHKDTIRIAALSSIAINWLPGTIKHFSIDHPNINADFRMIDLSDPIDQLLERDGMDVVLTSKISKGKYDWIHVMDDTIYAVLPPDFDDGGQQTFDVERFNGMEIYIADRGFDPDMLRVMESVKAKVSYKAAGVEDKALINLISQGLGAALLPGLAVRDYGDKVKLLPLSPEAHRDLGIAVRSLDDMSDAVRSFIEEFTDFVKKTENLA